MCRYLHFFQEGIGRQIYWAWRCSRFSKVSPIVDMFLSVTDSEHKDTILQPRIPAMKYNCSFWHGGWLPRHPSSYSCWASWWHWIVCAGDWKSWEGWRTLYRSTVTGSHASREMKEYSSTSDKCRRDIIFGDMDDYRHVDMGQNVCAVIFVLNFVNVGLVHRNMPDKLFSDNHVVHNYKCSL